MTSRWVSWGQALVARRVPKDVDATFAAWLAARDATRPWPVNRIEWTAHLAASFEIIRAAHADSRKGDGAFADVLDIMACQWLITLGVLHHYRRLSAALPPDERAAMPSAIYRFLDGLESTQGPDDEPYVRWLRRGPSAVGRWRLTARMLRRWSRIDGLRGSPPGSDAMAASIATVYRSPLVERHAASRGVPVWRTDAAFWFEGLRPPTFVEEDREARSFVDRLLTGLPAVASDLTAHDEAWLTRQVSESSALLRGWLATLRTRDPARFPAELWIGTSSDIWSQMLAKIAIEHGRHVAAHDHGTEAGGIESNTVPMNFGRIVTHFACTNAAQAAPIFARNTLDPKAIPELIMLGKPCTATAPRPIRRPPHVVYVPMTLASERRNLIPHPDCPMTYDFDRRLLQWFADKPVRMMLKPHPEFGVRYCRDLAKETGAAVLTGRFEEIVDDFDIVVFTTITSTTFQYSLDIGKPMVLIDFNFAPPTSMFRARIESGARIVPGVIDANNRLLCDFAAIDVALSQIRADCSATARSTGRPGRRGRLASESTTSGVSGMRR